MSGRVFYGPILAFHNLNMACRLFSDAFGFGCYLVGSSMQRADYRDVDVRCILADAEFDAMFPGAAANRDGTGRIDARLLALNLSVSAYLSQQSDLPVDFQFQRQTQANEQFKGERNPLGIERWQPTDSTPPAPPAPVEDARPDARPDTNYTWRPCGDCPPCRGEVAGSHLHCVEPVKVPAAPATTGGSDK